MFTVLRTLLILTHFIYDKFTAIHNFCLILHRKCIEIWCGENSRTEVEMLVKTASRTKQLPRHLVIVFGPKEDTILDCVRIIGWCITLGIPYVSFFDTNGFLAKNERFLQTEVAKRKPDLVEYINWGKRTVAPVPNGITGLKLADSKFKVRVSVLSDKDGKGEIVALAQELAKAVTTGTIKLEEINDELVEEKLKLREVPDPDLAFVYGHVCSTYGLLPWHTGTTEFFMLPAHDTLPVQDFTHLLEKYSKCEQRYGK